MRLLGFKSKTDTVVLSLQELVRRKRIEELKSMLGAVKLEIDIPKSRRRRAIREILAAHCCPDSGSSDHQEVPTVARRS